MLYNKRKLLHRVRKVNPYNRMFGIRNLRSNSARKETSRFIAKNVRKKKNEASRHAILIFWITAFL